MHLVFPGPQIVAQGGIIETAPELAAGCGDHVHSGNLGAVRRGPTYRAAEASDGCNSSRVQRIDVMTRIGSL